MKPAIRKTIALMQIVGGTLGFFSVGIEVIRWQFTGPTLAVAGILAAVFWLSLFAGLLLWQDLRIGYLASILVQLIQLPKLATVPFIFMMSFGVDAWVMSVVPPGKAGHVILFQPHLGEQHLLIVGPAPGVPLGLGMSVVSCVTLILLLRSLDEHDGFRKKV